MFAIGSGRLGAGRRRREKAGPGVKPGPGLSGPGAAGLGGVSGGVSGGPGAGRSRGVARAGKVEVNKA